MGSEGESGGERRPSGALTPAWGAAVKAVLWAVQAVVLLAVFAGLVLVVHEVIDSWDDWVVLAVAILTPIGLALAIYRQDYPSRSLKRRFGRSSGPDAPTPTAAGNRRRR